MDSGLPRLSSCLLRQRHPCLNLPKDRRLVSCKGTGRQLRERGAPSWCTTVHVDCSVRRQTCIRPRSRKSSKRLQCPSVPAAAEELLGEEDGRSNGSVEETGFPAPSSMAEVASLAIPALGMAIADPLMSLVDTACVGQVSSLDLASLGPNSAIFLFVFQVFGFLALATTNVLSSNSLRSPNLSAAERARRLEVSQSALSYAFTLAVICGLCVTLVLQLGAPWLLRLVGAGAELMPRALIYLRIRALAAPPVMLLTVAMGACLGQQDAWTPLKVFMSAAVLNLIGDCWLILGLGWGVGGAAAATTAAVYCGAALFMWVLWRQGQRPGGIPLAWKGFPGMAELRPFMGVAGSLLSRSIAGMSAYTVLTASATALGTLPCAAHQVSLQVFWFLSYVPEPLSLAAQSLIARDSSDPAALRSMASSLFKIGAGIGLVLALLVAAALINPRAFTTDPAVAAAVVSVIPQNMLATALCSMVLVCDGISIGSGQFGHIVRLSALSSVAVMAALAAGQAAGVMSLSYVWWTLVGFFVARGSQHLAYVLRNWDKTAFGGMVRARA